MILIACLMLALGCGKAKPSDMQITEQTDEPSETQSVEPVKEETVEQPSVTERWKKSKTDSWRSYELKIPWGEETLYGVFYLPLTDRETYPTVILSHGLGSSHQAVAAYAAAFAERGIACFIYDFCGGSLRSKSGGSMMEMSVLTELEQLQTVLTAISGYQEVDETQLFLSGESQGGFVSAMAAAENPETIKGLALIYPAFSIPDDARNRYPKGSEIEESTDFLGVTVGKRYFEDTIGLDAYAAATSYKGPVLILHGDQDTIVPLTASVKAAEVYTDAELIVFEGAGHGFDGNQHKEAEEKILSFLEGLIR